MTPLIDEMETGHAQRLCEALSKLALCSFPPQRYDFIRGIGEDVVWTEAGPAAATANASGFSQ